MNLTTNNRAKTTKGGLLLKAVMMLLVVCVAIGSCKSDDIDPSSLSDECYIQSVTLGQMKRDIYYSENDSTATITFSASMFGMTISHRDSTIQNLRPLPYGTRLNAVLVNIGHSGVLEYKYQGEEETHLYSSKDSMDCSKPVTLILHSTDGKSQRNYTLILNVEKEDGSKFLWTKVEDSDYLEADTARKLIVGTDGNLLMLGCTKEGVMTRYSRGAEDEKWSSDVVQYAGTAKMDLQSLTLSPAKDKLLMSTVDGSQLLGSTDGLTWTDVEACDGMHLIGASGTRLYAIADSLLYSKAEGEDWTLESTDADKLFTPIHHIQLLSFEQQSGYTRLVMIGQSDTEEADTTAIVWSKAWRTSDDVQKNRQLEKDAKWMSYPHESINRWLLPKMQPLFTFKYMDGIVAFGGGTATQPALSKVLYSPDFGLTWKTNDELSLDSQLSGAEGALAATIDDENFIWVVTGKETWRGRLNRLSK